MPDGDCILGAIAGDIIGSAYEWHNVKTTTFELFPAAADFTDDSVLTIATMHALMHQRDYAQTYQAFSRNYPGRGYGGMFARWIQCAHPAPYNSFGNGSAMRVSPVGWYRNSLEEVMHEARRSAEVTHNHPEGIKGAQAVATAVWLARTGQRKGDIRQFIERTFGYDLNRSIDAIRPGYAFDETCQGSVPEAIIAFLQSTDFEHAIRLAVSLGGDSDTIACMTGAIAQAYYRKIPAPIVRKVFGILPDALAGVVRGFTGVTRPEHRTT